MTWEAFVKAYAKQISGVARLLLARWRVPMAVAQGDVEQEVWMGAWAAWSRWREGRGGMSRAAYALCSGRLDAQRWLQVQRNSPRRGCSAPGRFPLAEAGLGDDVPCERVIEAGQDAAVAFGEAVRDALRACRTRRERRALEAVVASGFTRGPEATVEVVRRAWEAAR